MAKVYGPWKYENINAKKSIYPFYKMFENISSVQKWNALKENSNLNCEH